MGTTYLHIHTNWNAFQTQLLHILDIDINNLNLENT